MLIFLGVLAGIATALAAPWFRSLIPSESLVVGGFVGAVLLVMFQFGYLS